MNNKDMDNRTAIPRDKIVETNQGTHVERAVARDKDIQ